MNAIEIIKTEWQNFWCVTDENIQKIMPTNEADLKYENKNFCEDEKRINGQKIILFNHFIPFRNKLGCVYIDSYYFASHALYLMKRKIIEKLSKAGYEIGPLEVGLKPSAKQCGEGEILRNSLFYSKKFGSRIALEGFVFSHADSAQNEMDKIAVLEIRSSQIDEIETHENNSQNLDSSKTNFLDDSQAKGFCQNCKICEKVCPNGALKDGMFIREKCIRDMQDRIASLDNEFLPSFGNRVLGCELCQNCCPRQKIEPIDMPIEIEEVLNFENFVEIISGNREGREKLTNLIGKNYFRPTRLKLLTANAIKNNADTRYFPLLKKLCPDEKDFK